MKLLIVGKAKDDVKEYRGVDRALPGYVYEFDDNHRMNQLFSWSTEVHDPDIEYLTNLEMAEELVSAYAKLSPPQYFEIIEITFNDDPPVLPGTLLGYDIAAHFRSVLSWGMNYCAPDNNSVQLICLIQQYFQPKLNSNSLFPDYSLAKFCLACMEELNNLTPDAHYWEMGYSESDVRVQGVYLVQSKSTLS